MPPIQGTPSPRTHDRHILGMMIVSSAVATVARERISPEDFDDPWDALLFETILALEGNGEPMELPRICWRMLPHADLSRVMDYVRTAPMPVSFSHRVKQWLAATR